jgi:hypothetical protein
LPNGSSEEEIKKIEREEIVKIFGNAGQNDIEIENKQTWSNRRLFKGASR